jgi:O-6-methylguanine DNA methyltransferase
MEINSIRVFSPKQFASYIKTQQIYQKTIQTPAGTLLLEATQDGIFQTSFVEHDFKEPMSIIELDSVLLVGTPFQTRVWQEALKIPRGTSLSYHDLAHALGKPSAFRAVANALGANKIAYFVPCHRIVRKNGDLGGYAWGIERKQALLKHGL